MTCWRSAIRWHGGMAPIGQPRRVQRRKQRYRTGSSRLAPRARVPDSPAASRPHPDGIPWPRVLPAPAAMHRASAQHLQGWAGAHHIKRPDQRQTGRATKGTPMSLPLPSPRIVPRPPDRSGSRSPGRADGSAVFRVPAVDRGYSWQAPTVRCVCARPCGYQESHR
jgi:hypothetical protein